MSGGVDSSVAAHLLRTGRPRRDRRLHAARRAAAPPCVRRADAASAGGRRLAIVVTAPITSRAAAPPATPHDARRVADRLDIPFYAIDFQARLRQIIDYFIDEYTAARTPNPCVMCNNWIKFGRLFDYADSVGAEFVATGHYARLRADAPTAARHCSAASTIARTSRTSCSASSGDCSRGCCCRSAISQSRRFAAWPREIGLGVADKSDSQEICFVPERRPRRRSFAASAAAIDHGRRSRHHRRPGRRHARRARAIHDRPAQGTGHRAGRAAVRRPAGKRNQPRRAGHEGRTGPRRAHRQPHQLAGRPPLDRRRACTVKIRYNAPPAAGTRRRRSPAIGLHVAFDEPQYGVAPGQAVVCYDGDRVLGGGWIE